MSRPLAVHISAGDSDPCGILMTTKPDLPETKHIVLLHKPYTDVRDFELVSIFSGKRVKPPSEHDISEQCSRHKVVLYSFGTVLYWSNEEPENGRIETRECFRQPGIYPVRVHLGDNQLSIKGVMSPSRKTFVPLDKFPALEIPERLRMDLQPNIAVQAWVTLQLLKGPSIKYELTDFHEFSPSDQSLVRTMPWNEFNYLNYDRIVEENPYMARHYEVKPMETTCKHWPLPPTELREKKGIALSTTNVLCHEWQDVCVRLPLLVDHRPAVVLQPGTRVIFEATYLPVVGYYGLTFSKIDKNAEKSLSASENGNIRTSVRIVEKCPGFYECAALNVMVDDPLGLMLPVPFSKYAKSATLVEIKEGEPTPLGRARRYVAALAGDKARKLQEVLMLGEMKLVKEPGVVINHLGRVHISRFPSLSVSLPLNTNNYYNSLEAGTQVLIDGHFDPQLKAMVVDEAVRDQNKSNFEFARVFDRSIGHSRLAFRVSATGRAELPKLLFNETFGFIEPPAKFRVPLFPEQIKYQNVWISFSDQYPGDNLPPQCKFQYFYCGELPEHIRSIDDERTDRSASDSPIAAEIGDDSVAQRPSSSRGNSARL
ncbi:unnamed protein product [Caenorhabditis auriculariae]|uniref:Uncharacterized protein n=1 Tax=Caenorhabditis auriculariae TaxID=2777116 RepID=A0A8S1GX36_9PELO|nr:unnamed protein product [Caenorhabditis auriculariae]